MTGAQIAIAQLVAQGVTQVLSIPGEHNIALCDAILEYPELQYLTGRYEQGLVLMANGYSRASHQIAVPLIISGPGVTNGLTGLGDAYQDSVPMVAIAAQAKQNEVGKGSFHGLKNQTGTLASVTKWNTCVTSVAEIPEALRTAFYTAYEGRPGPTVVEIPLDVQTAVGEAEIYPVALPQPQTAPSDKIRQAAMRLAAAQSPFVYVGRGAAIAQAGDVLQNLIEWLNAPCFHTALGKGIIPADRALNVSWANGRSDYVARLMAQSDVVLVVGSSLDYADAGRGKLPFPPALIQIDTCPDIVGRLYPVELGLIGDAKLVLEELLAILKQQQPQPRPFSEPTLHNNGKTLTMSQHKAEKLAFFQKQSAWQYINALQSGITDDTLVFGDPARCNGWGVAFLDRQLPGTYHCSRNFCTLGYAIATAIGAKLAQPERPILAMIGDGGLLFATGDLATIVQYNLKLIIVLFNDNCYGSIRKAQRSAFGRTIGTDLQNPDFCQLARAFGLVATQVTQPQQLTKELKIAWERDRTTLIEIAMTPNDPGWEI